MPANAPTITIVNDHPPKMTHRIVFSDLAAFAIGATISVDGPEAYHAATVKRARIGDAIGVMDGKGHRSSGTLLGISGHKSGPTIEIQLGEMIYTPRTIGGVEVWTATPKGDRLETMIEQLSQLGVVRWRSLVCDRSERKWASVKADKLQRIAHESAKQCARPWFLEIGEPIDFSKAIGCSGAVVADGGGELATLPPHAGTTAIVLVGPEGGWSDNERDFIKHEGVKRVRLGEHVMRLETAACAVAVIFANQGNYGECKK